VTVVRGLLLVARARVHQERRTLADVEGSLHVVRAVTAVLVWSCGKPSGERMFKKEVVG
jgi:hypothetical protein